MSGNVEIVDGKSGSVSDKKFAVAVSEFNKQVTEKLLDAALETLAKHDVPAEQIEAMWVPGAWELALAAKRVIDRCDAVVCLGAVIKGETTHDEHINSMISQTRGKLSVETGKPIAFGVLSCNNADQTIQRSGGKKVNKGVEATMAAIEMLQLFDQLENSN